MVTGKNIMAAVLACCGIAAAGWYVSGNSVQHAAIVAENKPIRSDSFADQLNRKIMRVTGLSGDHSRSVIFDNDAATDDALALILIGNDPGVVLKAITVEGTGLAHGRPGAENMATIAYMLGKPDVPVAYGHARPMSSAGKPFPGYVRDAMDKLLVDKRVQPNPDAHITDNAVGLIKQVVDGSDEKVTILATGPLTNIAEFIKQYPQLKNKIEKIVILGGAINVPGNIHKITPDTNNRVSEWNFYADPEAAHRVFTSHIPITLVALDATNQVPMTKKFYESIALEDQLDLHLAHLLLKDLVDRYSMGTFINELYMWDGLAAMIMVDPSMAEIKSMPLVVDVTNGQVKMAGNHERHMAMIDVVTTIIKPDAALSNYVAMVKSNHIFAQRQFHHDVSRVTAELGRVSNVNY